MEKKHFTQISESLSEYIDNSGTSSVTGSLDDRKEFIQREASMESLIENDKFVRAEYHELLLTKKLVQRTKANKPTVPADVRQNVMAALETEFRNEQSSESLERKFPSNSKESKEDSWWETILQPLSSLVTQHRMAFAVLLLVVLPVGLYFAVPHDENNVILRSTEQQASVNFIRASFENYTSVRNGDVLPEFKTHSFEDLSRFFADKGVYYTIVRPETSAELIGGIVTEQKGVKIAHIVFNSNDTLVYMHQAPQDLFDNHALDVLPDVKGIIEKGDWYWEESSDTHVTLAAWKKGSVVCSVVADVPAWRLFQIVH